MTDSFALSLIFEATLTIMLVISILILPGMIVGLIVSVFQAATQINEQTLSFLPRLMATLVMVVIAGDWMLERIIRLFELVFQAAPGAIG